MPDYYECRPEENIVHPLMAPLELPFQNLSRCNRDGGGRGCGVECRLIEWREEEWTHVVQL